MERKYTKGEWENRNGRIFIKGTYNSIATVEVQKNILGFNAPDIERERNSALIASAPELLESCIEAKNMCDNFLIPTKGQLEDMSKLLESAINKALGK